MSKRILTIYEEHIAPCKIRGKLRKQYGELERGDPARIAINPNQSEEEYMDTLIHEIEARGPFGDVYIRVENIPSPDNPATSYLAALSILTLLRNLEEPLVVGT